MVKSEKSKIRVLRYDCSDSPIFLLVHDSPILPIIRFFQFFRLYVCSTNLRGIIQRVAPERTQSPKDYANISIITRSQRVAPEQTQSDNSSVVLK